jgi:hypothetical protein
MKFVGMRTEPDGIDLLCSLDAFHYLIRRLAKGFICSAAPAAELQAAASAALTRNLDQESSKQVPLISAIIRP